MNKRIILSDISEENIHNINTIEADFIAFDFRQKDISKDIYYLYFNKLSKEINKIAVFCNQKLDDVLTITADYDFDAVILFGKEKPEYCTLFKTATVNVIKAFDISDVSFSAKKVAKYNQSTDSFLFFTTNNSVELDKSFWEDIAKPFWIDSSLNIDNSVIEKNINYIGKFFNK